MKQPQMRVNGDSERRIRHTTVKRESKEFDRPVVPVDEHQLLNQMVLAFDWLERHALKADGKLTFDFAKQLVPQVDSLFTLVAERIVTEANKPKI